MCGIAGILSENTAIASLQRIQKAVACLAHRGPQKAAYYCNPESTVALGHRRLSIIDLSERAGQPMSFDDRYFMVFNGELYNYLELREQLRQRGYAFTSASDTEVVLAAYAAYGTDCLQQFDGAFAFAIWDEKKKELFAARDRFGEKPFYFYQDKAQLLFASEMKSLWAMDAPKEVDGSMLYNFLSIDYTDDPSDPGKTFFQGLHKLPAASFLTYSLAEKKMEIRKYWQIYPEVDQKITELEAVERFRSLFAESVRNRLRSDVPVGTSLSGGLDSSAVVAYCHQTPARQYSHKCFTAAFQNFEKDELAFAKTVAHHFGLQHYITEIGDEEVVPLMQKMMLHQEEPVTSASPLAQYKVFERAKANGVTVLLDGQGADEILGGYHKYYSWYWLELFGRNQLKKSGELALARELGIRESFGIKTRVAAWLPQFSAALQQSRKAKKAFRHPDLHPDFAFLNKRRLSYSLPAHFDLNGALYFSTFVHGLEELLRMADRNSMAHSLEVRLPFLYHPLVEFLFTLPPHFKIHRGWTKWILRKSVEEKLPEAITWRKEKVGFEPPQKRWMSDKRVQEEITKAKELLVQKAILRPGVLHKKIQPHDAYVAENRDWKYWSASFLFR